MNLKTFLAMTLDTCGIPEDQFMEIFAEKAKFLGRLLLVFHPSGSSVIRDEKIAWEMFQECVYATEDAARKIVDPKGKDDPLSLNIYVSREAMMEEIKSTNAKVEALADYVAQLVKVTTKGLEGIAEVIDKEND